MDEATKAALDYLGMKEIDMNGPDQESTYSIAADIAEQAQRLENMVGAIERLRCDIGIHRPTPPQLRTNSEDVTASVEVSSLRALLTRARGSLRHQLSDLEDYVTQLSSELVG